LNRVPIDRSATLRNAEQLLRQGKLDAAVAEYVQIVEEFPRDWTTANTLGDAYVRAGQTDKAVDQFIRIADGLSADGFLPKAAALYKKALKLKPGFEPALWNAAEIAATQGILADARAHLKSIEEKRTAAGDGPGALRARIRMDTLDPTNFAARRRAAAARAGLGEVAEAVQDLLTIARDQSDLKQFGGSVETLAEAGRLAPDNADIGQRLFEIHVDSQDFIRARPYAVTAEQLRQLAEAVEGAGGGDEALELREEAARLDPESDPAHRLALVAIEISQGRGDEAVAIALELLQRDPVWRERILAVALEGAENTAAAFRCAQLVADSHAVDGEWQAAADAVAAFAERAPEHLPVHERLVEICEDGLLEARLTSALARLADAYLAGGLAEQARIAAEELVAREPWEHANVDRFRRALLLLHEPDPDAVIASRLGGEPPFVSTALSPVDVMAKAAAPAEPVNAAAAESVDRPAPLAKDEEDEEEEAEFLVDLDAEVSPTPEGSPVPDLDEVFDQLRGQVSKQSVVDAAQNEYRRAVALRAVGDLDGCVDALQIAARTPALQFAAGSLLARVYKERGQMADALDWFERAAQAPAPSPGEYHEVLFELVEGFEAAGDVTRALAIGLELQADAGSYRDVDERVDRLAKVQARG
jgi:tetratricopeptide (TPR) repeat protein